MTLLQIRNLSIEIAGRSILKNVTLSVNAGEVVGLVGESGSGKSLTSMSAIGMLPRAARISGHVKTCGIDVLDTTEQALRDLRRKYTSIIFQDPLTALAPTRRINAQMMDIARIAPGISGAGREEILTALADACLPDPARIAASYPFELSGGQRQRVLIAMAFLISPALVIADEITTAIDASLRSHIMELLQRYGREKNSGLLLVSHDLDIVRKYCERVYVMYRGSVVEHGSSSIVLDRPVHPYTQMLIDAEPARYPKKTEFRINRNWEEGA